MPQRVVAVLVLVISLELFGYFSRIGFVSYSDAGEMGESQDKAVNEGMTFTDYLAIGGERAVIEITDYDVMIVKIQKTAVGTNANPPLVQIIAQEILRGKLERGPYKVLWEPYPYNNEGMPEEFIQKWKQEPLEGPKEGALMLIVGTFDAEKNLFTVSPLGYFQYSEEKKQWALEGIQKGKEGKKKLQAQEEQKRKTIKKEVNKWYSGKSDPNFNRLISEADFIGMGKVVSFGLGEYMPTFEITEIMKGIARKDYGGRYYVNVKILENDYKILYNYSEFLQSASVMLFLKEIEIVNPDPRSKSVWKPKYNLVDKDHGLIPVFKGNFTKIKKTLEKK